MPVDIDPNDDGLSPLITYEDDTHIVVTIEIPKAALRQMRRFLQALVTIAAAE